MTRKSTASSWLWLGNKYYYIIYYDNIWQNVDIFLNKKQQQHIYTIVSYIFNDKAPVISLWIQSGCSQIALTLWSDRAGVRSGVWAT